MLRTALCLVEGITLVGVGLLVVLLPLLLFVQLNQFVIVRACWKAIGVKLWLGVAIILNLVKLVQNSCFLRGHKLIIRI